MHDFVVINFMCYLLTTNCLSKIFNSIILCAGQFNFVGRILGPRGLTAKQLENDTGCKIMVRGKGSMRDKQKVRSDVACLYFKLGGKIVCNVLSHCSSLGVCCLPSYQSPSS